VDKRPGKRDFSLLDTPLEETSISPARLLIHLTKNGKKNYKKVEKFSNSSKEGKVFSEI